MKKFFLKSKRFWYAIAPTCFRIGFHWLSKKGLFDEEHIPDAVDALLTGMQALGIYYVVKGGVELTTSRSGMVPSPTPPTADVPDKPQDPSK